MQILDINKMLGLINLLDYLWKLLGLNEAQGGNETLCQIEKDVDEELKWKDSNDEDHDGKVMEIKIAWSKRKES